MNTSERNRRHGEIGEGVPGWAKSDAGPIPGSYPRKILIATDFTEASENATKFIMNMFGHTMAEFILVHGFKPMVPYSNAPSLPVMENELVEDQLRQKLKIATLQMGREVRVKPYFEKGGLSEVINKIAEKEKPDLIVMSSRRKRAMENTTLGSNAMEIVENTQYPVLLVPIEADFTDFNHITLASDFKPLDISSKSIEALHYLLNIGRKKLTLLHVYEPKDAEELNDDVAAEPLKKYLSHIEYDIQRVISSDPFEGIMTFIEEHQPDLVAVMPRSHNFFERLFHTTTTEKMIHRARVPLLVLK